jgi:hypothetical protein
VRAAEQRKTEELQREPASASAEAPASIRSSGTE